VINFYSFTKRKKINSRCQLRKIVVPMLGSKKYIKSSSKKLLFNQFLRQMAEAEGVKNKKYASYFTS